MMCDERLYGDHSVTSLVCQMESPTLSEGQLQELLDQCARTMSRATAETNSLAQSTSRSECGKGLGGSGYYICDGGASKYSMFF